MIGPEKEEEEEEEEEEENLLAGLWWWYSNWRLARSQNMYFWQFTEIACLCLSVRLSVCLSVCPSVRSSRGFVAWYSTVRSSYVVGTYARFILAAAVLGWNSCLR